MDMAAKEHELFATFEAIGAPLALFDGAGRLLLANPTFEQRFARSGLGAAGLAKVVAQAGPTWKRINLKCAGRNGGLIPVLAIAAEGRVLLTLQEGGDLDGAGDVARLRRRVADLEQLASTDYLTGAWNRSHFDRIVAVEMERSMAVHQPICLLLVDIDHFKTINDTLGHTRGDVVLRELAALLRDRVRPSDLVFRWGGEEFVILMSAVGHDGGRAAAEALRQATAEHTFSGGERITISIGVAEHDGEQSPSAWFDRLDAALYAAKQSGRNRVVVACGGNSDGWSIGERAPPQRLIWNGDYACGDETIDSQHQRLFELSNLLIDGVSAPGVSTEDLNPLLDRLIDQVAAHFEAEERILEGRQYGQLAEHRQAHRRLLQRALAFRAALGRGEAGPREVTEFLVNDVVARHLMSVDRAYFPIFSDAASARTPAGAADLAMGVHG